MESMDGPDTVHVQSVHVCPRTGQSMPISGGGGSDGAAAEALSRAVVADHVAQLDRSQRVPRTPRALHAAHLGLSPSQAGSRIMMFEVVCLCIS
jgi:hypothetical protein